MTSHFYLFLPKRSGESVELNSASVSWVYKDVNNELKLSHGLLSDAVVAAENQHITIVLPGEDVLSLVAEVPGTNIQRIQQAVPYVLEDSVIDDVDDLYFAIQKSNTEQSDNQYDVAVINKEYFESLVLQLKSAGIHADAMTADYLLLADSNILFFDGSRVSFNSPNLKFSSEIDSELNLADEGVNKLISCSSEENCKLDDLLSDIDSQVEHCSDHPLLCLVKNSSMIIQ